MSPSDLGVPFRRMAATGTGSESVKVMDYASRERLLTIVTDATLSNPVFSPDGNVLAAQRTNGGSAGTIYFWRAPSWAEIEKAEAAEAAKVAGKPAQ